MNKEALQAHVLKRVELRRSQGFVFSRNNFFFDAGVGDQRLCCLMGALHHEDPTQNFASKEYNNRDAIARRLGVSVKSLMAIESGFGGGLHFVDTPLYKFGQELAKELLK